MKINKKIIVSIIVLSLLIFLCFLFIIIRNKKIENENKEPVFRIAKILLYSSADVTDNSPEGLLQDLDIHQFTDIAIYIDNRSYIQDLTSKNTIKEISIYNIKLDTNSDIGEKFINYKNPLLYGKFDSLSPSDKEITFDVITTNDENSKTDYNSPVFFADCSNPVSIRIFKPRNINKL